MCSQQTCTMRDAKVLEAEGKESRWNNRTTGWIKRNGQFVGK